MTIPTIQQTVARSINCSGIGLHSGKTVNLKIHPASINHGIKFVRTDLPDKPVIPARFNCVVDTSLATVIGAEPLDLARKIEKARSLRGPRMIIALAPCPTGWDYDPKESVEIGKLAVKTGVWPLREYVDGKVVHTKQPHPRIPVEEYLVRQGRFRHLFEPQRDEQMLAEIQQRVDAYWSVIE
jgi:hypothetical protein